MQGLQALPPASPLPGVGEEGCRGRRFRLRAEREPLNGLRSTIHKGLDPVAESWTCRPLALPGAGSGASQAQGHGQG